MEYSYGEVTVIVLPLRSGRYRSLIAVDGNPVAFEDAPTEYEAFHEGLAVAAQVTRFSHAELEAAWGRPARVPVRAGFQAALSAYGHVPRTALAAAGRYA